MKLTLTLIAALGVSLIITMVTPLTASAHHPVVSGVAECDDDSPGYWQVRWTVKSDAVRGYEWSIGEAGTKPDSQDYVFVERGLSQDTITKTITATWYDQEGRQVAGPSTSTSAPVSKPTGCTPETTTPETTTTWPASTTSTPTTASPTSLVTTTIPVTTSSTSTSSPTTSTTTSDPEQPTTSNGTPTSQVTDTTTAGDSIPTTDTDDTVTSSMASSSTPSGSGESAGPQLPETGASHRGIALIASLLVGFGLLALWVRTPR